MESLQDINNRLEQAKRQKSIPLTDIITAVQGVLSEADNTYNNPQQAAIKAVESLAAYKALIKLLDHKRDFKEINNLFVYEKIKILSDRAALYIDGGLIK